MNQHDVWMDNFRVILTFNSILLTGSFAVVAIILDNKSDSFLFWTSLLPLIGIVVTVIGMKIIERRRDITKLRQKEIREVEKMFQSRTADSQLPVYPFSAGYVLMGGSRDGLEELISSDVEPIKSAKFRGYKSYSYISCGFIIVYLFMLWLSFLSWSSKACTLASKARIVSTNRSKTARVASSPC
jgi:hypothetical protein